MPRLLGKTRFLIILPIIGLAIAACVLFILGGLGLLRLLANVVLQSFGVRTTTMLEPGQGAMIFSIVEFVHTFLVGTVLYITAVGLYQLFIGEIPFPGWLKIDSVEELETDLIGVTVVVMAVNFMGAMFVGGQQNLLQFGAAIALPIAALGLFVGLRAWSLKLNRSMADDDKGPDTGGEGLNSSSR